MGDTSYLPSKPNGTTTAAAAATTTANKPPPPNKSQPNNNLNRHPYRPNPNTYHRNHHRHRRSYLCLCCFWSILILILLLLLATIAACILYLLYRPHRPTFSVTALKISQFNLTTTADDTTHLTSQLNLTISTKNPNKKVAFHYDPFAIACVSHDTQVANGSFPDPFASDPNNITVIRSSLYSNSLLLETTTVNQIRSDLKKKKYGMPLKILLDTEARVKIESLRSKKVGIRIECEGIHSFVPKNGGGGKSSNSSISSVTATVSEAKCKVDLRIKIWKWTFSS
ncbi:hypothetical protein OSB04_030127 [Centaurea solstitialis]|uniref:Late embryogenesis abundant protein LEA-2 subgroup domain-containing protein n=1 Tax=Centaurea solstitialis TaxID=347529 RepID=A0AA38W4N3_9ASTR|nr:hypothetical protein OSB04_030127 [Centaurea solstitialis]